MWCCRGRRWIMWTAASVGPDAYQRRTHRKTAASWEFSHAPASKSGHLCQRFPYLKQIGALPDFAHYPASSLASRCWQGLKALSSPPHRSIIPRRVIWYRVFHLEQICWPEFWIGRSRDPADLNNDTIISNEMREEEQTRLDPLLLLRIIREI